MDKHKRFKPVTDPSIVNGIKALHEDYNDRISNFYSILGNDLNRFSWFGDKKVTIFILKVFLDSIYPNEDYTTIAFAKPSPQNKILLIDLIKETKNPDFNKITGDKDKINWLINKKILNPRILKNLISASFISVINMITSNPYTMKRWAKAWAEKEYNTTLEIESNPTPINHFPKISQRYFIDRYHFEDMLRIINNDQFTDELGQCMFAYEHEKWFLCAAGLGSCLEHLMYMVLNNYDTKGYEDNNGRRLLSRFPKSPTARDYITWFSKPPINIDARQKSAFNLYFMARNSVDHFNTGKTQRIFCDVLLDGISETFNNYFQASVEAQPFRENNDN